jgi:two-component sensor histidine kinase
LALALAIALLPVLVVTSLQSVLAFQQQAQSERVNLTAAAQRSAAAARGRIESAQVLLQALAPGSAGVGCAQRLAVVAGRIPGYENLARFDAHGGVACAARPAPDDAGRAARPWFDALRNGVPVVLTSAPGAAYADPPSLLAAVPTQDSDGRFNGAMAAVMTLDSLRPHLSDPSLPAGSEVALINGQGKWLSAMDPSLFPATLADELSGPGRTHSQLWIAPDRPGQDRLLATAPLVGDEVFVAMSAPDQGIISWAWLNPVSALALPLLGFGLALTAVWIVAERGVVRWIAYLQRIAAIYTRGRFTVRPVRAEQAPPEIRDLAETLDAMAATIVARDAALMENLAQKDALLLEIHHRVKNNLQIISSLLNLQQRALRDPAARTAIFDTRQRIAALALVYRSLYQGPDLRRIDLREFLEELVGQLVTTDGGQQLPIRTDFACDPVTVDPDRLAPIALFAVEAISNARKHGLEDRGRLSIAFRVRGLGAELSITDTGYAGRTSKLGLGVGRTLMTAYARQLRGEATFRANPDGGLTAKLTFSLPRCAPGSPVDSELSREAVH